MLIRKSLMLAVTFLAVPVCDAQKLVDRYQAGRHYFVLEQPQPTISREKIEVLEAFSYGCVHCWQFQPKVDAWKKRMPANVAFVYLPVTFRTDFALFARGYYAAEALGIVERTHHAVFEAVFTQRAPVRTLEDLTALYATLGIDARDFDGSAKSFAVETRLRRVEALLPRYQIDGTPEFVVNGKYLVTPESAGGYDNLLDVVDMLVAKEADKR